MNKPIIIAMMAMFALAMSSCGGDDGVRDKKELENARMVSDVAVPLNGIFRIEQWGWDGDNGIVVVSDKNDKYVTILDTADFSVKSSYGSKGHGPGEYMHPKLAGNDGGYILIDNMQRKVFEPRSGSTAEIKDNAMYNIVNLVDYPIVAFMDEAGQSKVWKLQNILTGEVIESIDIENDGKGCLVDELSGYSHVTGKDAVVLAGRDNNLLIIGSLSDSGKVNSVKVYRGSEESGSEFYTTVAYNNGNIYLLSQKKVSMSPDGGITGVSEIEIYNTEGEPVDRLSLGFVAVRMLVDSAGKRILLSSAMDDNLHIVSL